MTGTRKLTIAAVALVFALVAAGVAFGDYVVNTVDNSMDDDLEVLAVTAGGTATTKIWVLNQTTAQGDTNQPCNLAGANTDLKLNVLSSDETKATVSPSQITIEGCDNDASGPNGKTITVTGVAAGTSTISFTIAENTGTGSFDLGKATFTANVTGAVDPCASVATPDAPLISFTPANNDGNGDWYKTVPTVLATTTTAGATIEYATDGSTFSGTAPTLGQGTTTVTARATSATCDKSSTSSRSVDVDSVPPSVTPGDVVDTTWRNTDLSEDFESTDATSGLADETNDAAFTLTASAESADATTPTTDSRTVFDVAGNSTTRTVSAYIDLTNPTNVQFVGGPADGGVYFPSTVPAVGTCSADDAPSGLSGCVVTGRSTDPGTHTLTATATDNAGNQATATRTYRVRTLTAAGFFQPVDMTSAGNAAKAGSTVPLKFTVSDEGVPQTATAVVASFKQTAMNCQTLAEGQIDDIEEYTAGKTALRHDGSQFIQNWQTPKQANSCYRVTVTLVDGTQIKADFRLK